jgi:IS605 OrfB family transposase
LRVVAAPFVVAAPGGARVRDRLRLSERDAVVVWAVGELQGRLYRRDLAERVRLGDVPAKDTQRARRKRELTAGLSSRWAGAITRTSEDQYQLAMRCLRDERTGLRRAVRTIQTRLAVECGWRRGRVRGYADRAERWQKQRRLAALAARLAGVERRIARGRPAIVIGGRRLARLRHHVEQAELTVEQWRDRWDAERLFLTADGESGAPHGNYTISVTPDGDVTIVLPAVLRHLANAPRGRYRLDCRVTFHHRREKWLDRIAANAAVRYDLTQDPVRDRWYLDASWTVDQAVLPTPGELTAAGARLLAVDLNAAHLAVCVVDPHGNPVGPPDTVPLELIGPASTRDGRLRAAITDLITLARERGCVGIAIENLGFTDARATGRETMGRGQRGKRFRRAMHGIPTARFRQRLAGMAYTAGLVVVAVDPAYTSIFGRRYWQKPLQQQAKTTIVTGHHGAGVAIGRRAHGYGLRRRPGVTRTPPADGVGRATGQAVSRPPARGTATPPRMPGTPTQGRKTRARQRGPLTGPDLEHHSRGHPAHPGCDDVANTGQHH